MKVRNLLVIRACAIGDFVFNVPALTALKRTHPDARFTLVGNASTLELAREFVTVKKIYSIESPPWSQLFYEPVSRLEFDSAIVWMKNEAIAGNLRLSGIPNVVRRDPFPAHGHAADHLLRTLNLDQPPLPDLWAPDSDDVVIHPGSGSPKKNWPYFEELVDKLPNAIVLVGPASKGKGVRVLENLSLPEVFHYLRRCRAYIGNDSGITHLAAYLGCPTIALFGPTDPRVWGPIGRRARIIWKSKLEDITVDEVVQSVVARGTGQW
jgi:ADP-heptose:LPS heptosyltransferase